MKLLKEIDCGDYHLKPLELPADNWDDPVDQTLRRLSSPARFSVETLCAAVHSDCTIETIKWYLQGYGNSPTFQKTMSAEGWPALYYAVERNSPELVSILLQNGLDPKETHKEFKIPLLAFAIIHGYREAIDTTGVAKVLLAFGVDPKVIPMDMWSKFLETPKERAESSWGVPRLPSQPESSWCTLEIRPLLAKSLHVTHRYLLHLAHKLKNPNSRYLQISKANKMMELTKLPYFLIGQRPASNIVMNNVYSHIALGSKDPMMMAFAGASGHGKTEMARAMGDLLSVKTTVVDCASVSTVWGLLGPTSGWSGYEQGSQLNNFLVDNSGLRSVVFLDEFDKTKQEIRDALLLMTEKGEYADRRNNIVVDCSKTIWVIATNLGADKIAEYYTKHLEKLSDAKRDKADMRPLQAELKRIYRNEFGAPFTGRINLIVPFLPFTAPEQAVVLHKFVLKFATLIRQPIDLQPDVSRLIGHCRLTLIDDGKICVELTDLFYNKDLGARSLANAVKEIERQFVTEYSSIDEPITETMNSNPLQSFVVRRIPVGDGAHEVGVFADIAETDDTEDGEGR